MMGPRREAAAYMLWCAAKSADWECSVAEAARAAGLDVRLARHIVQGKGWKERFKDPLLGEGGSLAGRKAAAVRLRDGESCEVDLVDVMGWGG